MTRWLGRRRVASRVALVLLALVVGAACGEGCETDTERDTRLARENFERSIAFSSVTAGPSTPQPVTGTPSPAPTPFATGTPMAAEFRYASISPIQAVFDQGTFTTTYTLPMEGHFPQGILVDWSGPNCGTIDTKSAGVGAEARSTAVKAAAVLTWAHPHPPCAATSNHSEVTVVATIREGFGHAPVITTICTYAGSGTGRGPACQQAR